ncbi:molybdate ABC transporter substrate-binding protein [Marinomonas dokdonensis]|uniref:molybdate ABC transporter substrate-binding protein n=1 Tax=Marinomonas dokdonensis TaxID=328224 RepID=UPI0040554604
MPHRRDKLKNTAFSIYRWRVVLICLTLSLSTQVFSQPLRLAVASNFIAPMTIIAQRFEQVSGHEITLAYASSAKLYAQIQHGAPYDAFLSADTENPQKLIAAGLAKANSFSIYAQGQLALWSATPLETQNFDPLFTKARRIAIANPKLAPYGMAAQQSLESLKLWDSVKSKLVQGENIGQAFQFAYSHNADLGLVALSQVLAYQDQISLSDKETEKQFLLIPANLHKPINQAVVSLVKSPHQEAIEEFLVFLNSPDIQRLITRFGYLSASPS